LLSRRGSGSRWTLAGILVVAFVAANIGFGFFHRRDQYDDSYITYRYALNLAQGKGLVFNSYERINSASSFLYTVILALAYKIGFHDLELFAALFGFVMGGLLIAVTFLMASKLTERPAEAFAVTFPLCIAGSIGGWAVSGMETIFFAALVMAFLHLYLFTRAARPVVYALLGLVALCRPEGLILLGLVVLREIAAARADRAWRGLAWPIVLAVAPVAALAVFYRAYYGTVVPHSVYLKRVAAYYAPGLIAQSAALARFYIGSYLGYVLLAGVAIHAAARSLAAAPRARWSPLAFLSAYVVVSVLSLLVEPISDGERYSVHLLPVFAVLAVAGWQVLGQRLRTATARRVTAATAVLVLVVGATRDSLEHAQFAKMRAAPQAASREVGIWVASNTRPGEIIASADLGEIAYYAPERDFVDVSGLVSGGFAELSQTRPDLLPDLFAQKRPAYIADLVRSSPFPGEDGAAPFLTTTELTLAHPSLAFRNVSPEAAPPRRPPYARKPVFSRGGDDWSFIVVALGWNQP